MLPAYLAIRAFNIEVARIPDMVSNPTVGTFRMQFWRDTINATFDIQPPAEPVAILLASVLATYKMNKSWFMRLISTRERTLTHPGYTNLTELETYAENTYSTVLYLTLSAYPLKSLTMDHLASHIGKAAGICAVLRGFPLLAFPPPPTHHSNPAGTLAQLPSSNRQGVITLPLDVMSASGVREEDVYRQCAAAPGLKDAIFAVATRASDHLITARSMLQSIKRYEDPGHPYEHEHDEGHDYGKYGTGVRLSGERRKEEYEKGFGVVMGPAVSTQLWLDRLQKCDFDVFNASLRGPEWKLPLVAWWKHRNEQI
jgi:NADH dehydrogenase [ubiquinone] 1 alpha subcomplex assembly factor 6